jgi:hypothetical protein
MHDQTLQSLNAAVRMATADINSPWPLVALDFRDRFACDRFKQLDTTDIVPRVEE